MSNAMKKLSPVSFPIGVDLVEIKKAKLFFERHRANLRSLFSKREIRYIKTNKKPYEKLALLLAAREAVFKALLKKARTPSLSAFYDIRIIPNKSLSCVVREKTGAWKAPKEKLKLLCHKTDRYVIVECRGR